MIDKEEETEVGKIGTECFVITGAAITWHARDIMLSEDPGHAYRLIADGIIGEHAAEAAMSILRGEKDLVGDSSAGLALVDAEETEDLARYKRDLAYIYAGRIRMNGVWRHPVAWIGSVGYADGKWACDQLGGMGFDSVRFRAGDEAWHRKRAEYYCSPDEIPRVGEIPGEDGRTETRWVVWRRCGEPPHWVRTPSDVQVALTEALAAGRSLEKRMPDAQAWYDAWEERVVSDPAVRAAAYEEEDRQFEQRVSEIGEQVRAQAGADTFTLTVPSGRAFEIPRVPFVRWALKRVDHSALPPWENVAPIGIKMAMDDPDHTDWVLGAGMTLEEAYRDEEITDAVWDVVVKLQREHVAASKGSEAGQKYAEIFAAIDNLQRSRHDAAVVVNAGERTGVVGVDIAVLPDSEASRVKELSGKVGVIVEKAGKLAHFAVVSRGRGITVMRHPDACDLFTPGMRVSLSPASGRISVLEEEQGDGDSP